MKSLVKRRPFGKTGLNVSEVSLGAMNLRQLNTIDEGLEILNYVIDQGINLIDTARAYNGVNKSGQEVQSEALVGQVIASRTDIDEPMVIVTKGHGYTPEAFDEGLETSLKTLGVRQTENGLFIGSTEIKLVYFFHGIKEDRWQSIKESGAIEHALKRQKEGKFTYLGFSSHYGDKKEIKEALDTGVFQVVELPYNVYNRALGEDGEIDLIKYAHDMGVAIVNMKCFNGNGMVPATKIIGDVCDISYPQMLKFVLSNPYVSTIDAGAKRISEFEMDIKASVEAPLTADERSALKAEADKVSVQLNSICRECLHCLEKFSCPMDINFPAVLGVHARFSLAEAFNKDTKPYIEQYKALPDPKADACVACGGCVEWCEYHLDIPAMMAKAKEDLDN